MKILIIGSGFSGAVIAEQLAQSSMIDRIDIIDERDHIGGNCFTEKDKETGIMIHKYGPHIFNTSNELVWNYIKSFDEMMPYKHQVKATTQDKVYSLPINLHTINQFFNKRFSPNQAKEFIEKIGEKIDEPNNFEEQALKFIGKDLYYAFFHGYTKKQWGCDPTEIPASVLARLPVRFNYNDSYYNHKFVGIPKNGYTYIIEKMISSPKITVTLNKKIIYSEDIKMRYNHIFYTGPIDSFFNNKFGNLGYRTVTFERIDDTGDFQGCPVMNYPDLNVPFTRITEHKHFTYWEEHDKTICYKEYSKETEGSDVPYYPKRLMKDKILLEKYLIEAKKLSNVTFLGRLAKYQYMDMHQVIDEALTIAKEFLKNGK